MSFYDVNQYLEILFTVALQVCATDLQIGFISNIIITLPDLSFLELMEHNVNIHTEDSCRGIGLARWLPEGHLLRLTSA